eukprot:gene26315-17409_t
MLEIKKRRFDISEDNPEASAAMNSAGASEPDSPSPEEMAMLEEAIMNQLSALDTLDEMLATKWPSWGADEEEAVLLPVSKVEMPKFITSAINGKEGKPVFSLKQPAAAARPATASRHGSKSVSVPMPAAVPKSPQEPMLWSPGVPDLAPMPNHAQEPILAPVSKSAPVPMPAAVPESPREPILAPVSKSAPAPVSAPVPERVKAQHETATVRVKPPSQATGEEVKEAVLLKMATLIDDRAMQQPAGQNVCAAVDALESLCSKGPEAEAALEAASTDQLTDVLQAATRIAAQAAAEYTGEEEDSAYEDLIDLLMMTNKDRLTYLSNLTQ